MSFTIFYTPLNAGQARARLRCSEAVALQNLEKAANEIVKNARWHPYRTIINELRKPLIQLKLSRK